MWNRMRSSTTAAAVLLIAFAVIRAALTFRTFSATIDEGTHVGAGRYTLQGDIPTQGWVAISDHYYQVGRSMGAWGWLADRSYERIGASSRLYYIR